MATKVKTKRLTNHESEGQFEDLEITCGSWRRRDSI